MTGAWGSSVHASAVLVGRRAVLIRGPSGSGKSRLAFELILAGRAGQIPPATLVGDDRVHLALQGADVVVRPSPRLAGLIEIRGLGIRGCDFAGEAIVALVVDLSAKVAARLPAPDVLQIDLLGVQIPRIPVGPGFAALPLVLAALTTDRPPQHNLPSADCWQGIGNHIEDTLATE